MFAFEVPHESCVMHREFIMGNELLHVVQEGLGQHLMVVGLRPCCFVGPEDLPGLTLVG